MNILSHYILAILITVFTYNSFANSQSKPWVKFSCSTSANVKDQSLTLLVGQPYDGWPLISFMIDGEELAGDLVQYKFVYNQKEQKFDSHLTWLHDEKKLPDSQKSDAPPGTKALSVAEIKSQNVVVEGIPSTKYVVSRLATVLRRDRENTRDDSSIIKYNCLEPLPL